jgi:hypothetical protein
MTRSTLAPSGLEERERGPLRKTVAPIKGFPWESATEPVKQPYPAAEPGTAFRLRRSRLPARRKELSRLPGGKGFICPVALLSAPVRFFPATRHPEIIAECRCKPFTLAVLRNDRISVA